MEHIRRGRHLVHTVVNGKIAKTIEMTVIFQNILKQICRFVTRIIAEIPLPYIIAPLLQNQRDIPHLLLIKYSAQLLC